MRTQLHKAMRRATLAAMAPVVLLPAGAGGGGLLRLLPSPLEAVLPVALAAVAVVGAVLWLVVEYRVEPLKRVDWATAEEYERRLTESLSLGVRAVLVGAEQRVRGRTRAAVGVHLYVMRPPADHQASCTIDAGRCPCARLRLSAALVPSRRHPVLVIGERLLDRPVLLSFVLAHEAHHARRASRTLRLVLGGPLLAGWLALGLTVPARLLLILAPALWLVTAALCWGDELRADVAAIRAIGPQAARDYWALVQRARPRPAGLIRVLGAVGWLLAPHPPFWVRAALAARVTGPRPTPRP